MVALVVAVFPEFSVELPWEAPYYSHLCGSCGKGVSVDRKTGEVFGHGVRWPDGTPVCAFCVAEYFPELWTGSDYSLQYMQDMVAFSRPSRCYPIGDDEMMVEG